MKIGNTELRWLGHDGFLIKNSAPLEYPDKPSSKLSTGGKIIYIDPFKIGDDCEKADMIFITHAHYDHCSVEDMAKIVKEGTKIIMPADCQSKINRFDVPVKTEIVEENHEMEIDGIKVCTLPAYNIDKHFHPRDAGGLSYLIKFDDLLIYHAGDTDLIPEMQKLTGYKQEGKDFVALLPVSGRFVMTAEEAAEAAKLIKPTLAIPMHYGAIIGNEDDAREFKELCEENGIKAEIMEKA